MIVYHEIRGLENSDTRLYEISWWMPGNILKRDSLFSSWAIVKQKPSHQRSGIFAKAGTLANVL